MITLKTKRLTLEPLGMKYLETVHKYASDYENTKYMIRLPNATIEETIAFLQGADAEWASAQPSFYEFAVLCENQQIGAVSVYLDEERSGELGWIIDKTYWRQGFAYEAAAAMVDFAVRELNIRHFIAHCDAENIASYKIMEKLGMSRTDVYGGRQNKRADTKSTEYQYELYV